MFGETRTESNGFLACRSIQNGELEGEEEEEKNMGVWAEEEEE